jgi:hypothetical protein
MKRLNREERVPAIVNETIRKLQEIVEPLEGWSILLTDPGADAIFGWDDSAGAWEALTKAEAQTVLGLTTSSTDNAIARFDSTAGNIQNSTVTIDDNGDVTAIGVSGGTSGPTFQLYHNSASPAASDVVGKLQYVGNDAAGANKTVYGELYGKIFQTTNGTEYGCLAGQVMTAGAQTDTSLGTETFLLGYANPASNNFEYVFRAPSGKRFYTYLESFDPGVNGPELHLWHAGPNQAVSDEAGDIYFDGRDSGGTLTPYGRINCHIASVTDGSEEALLGFWTPNPSGGSLRQIGYFALGLVVGAPTGGDKGFGTINASSIYNNGTLLYTESSYTPTLAFGGATTGITYTSQAGRYVQVGNQVTAWASITVNSNGSASGTATISLPVTASNVSNLLMVGQFVLDEQTTISGDQHVMVVNNTTTAQLREGITGNSTVLTEADIPDGSILHMTVTYYVGA